MRPTPAKTVVEWQPRGLVGWLLSVLAIAFVIALVLAAFAMAYPLPFDSALGLLGLLLLIFPLHLLVVTAVTVALTWLAWIGGARLAASVFLFTALLSGVMALWPSLAIWRFAQQDGVSVSLGTYLAGAAHLNQGSPQLDRTVAYGTASDGAELLLDVWPAADDNARTPRPALLLIHGGAFVGGNRSQMPDWDRWFNQLGYTVFDIGYRLPPPVRWQDEIGDVKCALGWVAAHAKEYRINPARIGIAGYSAGATLALVAAYSVGNPRLPPSCDAAPVVVHWVINLYGIPDMPGLYDTSPSLRLVHDAAARYIGGGPSQYPERHRAVSPMTYVGPSAPPTISFLGTDDRIIPASQLAALDKALKAAGAISEAYLLPATDHAFEVNWGSFAAQFARAKIAAFLGRNR
ncbi:MAG TPA: alpha/beta hydrolase [Stellaceae bacterium]|nr:alpha/beta hydrolase [Stellaceae bacterium]